MRFRRALLALMPVAVGVAVGGLASILVAAPLVLLLEALVRQGLHASATMPQLSATLRLHTGVGLGALAGGGSAGLYLCRTPGLAHRHGLAGLYAAAVPMLLFTRLAVAGLSWQVLAVDLLFVASAALVGLGVSRRVNRRARMTHSGE